MWCLSSERQPDWGEKKEELQTRLQFKERGSQKTETRTYMPHLSRYTLAFSPHLIVAGFSESLARESREQLALFRKCARKTFTKQQMSPQTSIHRTPA